MLKQKKSWKNTKFYRVLICLLIVVLFFIWICRFFVLEKTLYLPFLPENVKWIHIMCVENVSWSTNGQEIDNDKSKCVIDRREIYQVWSLVNGMKLVRGSSRGVIGGSINMVVVFHLFDGSYYYLSQSNSVSPDRFWIVSLPYVWWWDGNWCVDYECSDLLDVYRLYKDDLEISWS